MRDKAKKAASDKAYYARNKERIDAYQAEYRAAHREKTKAYNAQYVAENKAALYEAQRWYNMKSKYGVTRDDFHRMLEEQEDRCAICRSCLERPHIDHDHVTGVVRGLLCQTCNMGLGNFKDNTDRLQSAIGYLQRFVSVGEL